MNNSLPVRGGNTGANRLHQFKGPHRRHGAFFSHDILQRHPLDELHHQKRHRAAHDSKVSYGNNVLMTNCRGRESFLAKARNQIRIVADQIRKNDFDGESPRRRELPGESA